MGEYPSLDKTIALIDNTGVYASKNTLFPLCVRSALADTHITLGLALRAGYLS